MTCSICGLLATTTVARGGAQECLCLPCAEGGAGVVGLGGLIRAMAVSPMPTETCPYCGTTATQAKRTALAGCPLCYSALGEIWRSLGAPPGRYAGG